MFETRSTAEKAALRPAHVNGIGVPVSEAECLRDVLQNIKEAFWITDPGKSRMIYISPGYETLWGRSCESLYASPQSWMDAIHPDDRARVVQAAHSDQLAGRYDQEYRIVRPDGAIRWIRDRAFAVPDSDGGARRIVGIAEDISQRKSAEARLELQASAIEAAANAIVMTDASGRILFVNRAFTELTGYDAAEAIGGNPRILKSGAHDAAFYAKLWSTISAGQVWRGEVANRRKDGLLYFEEMTITPVKDADGKIAHFIAVKQDISRRKAAEEENERNLRRIAALHEIDTAITSSLHLRTVLAILLEKVELFFPLAAASAVRLIDMGTGEVQPVACRNLDEEEWKAETTQIHAGLKRMLMDNREAEAVLDVESDPRPLAKDFLKRWGVASMLRVPLLCRGEAVGVLTIFTKVQHEFTAAEIEFMKTLAGQAAIAIHNAQLFAQTERTASRLAALREIDSALTSSLDLSRILAVLLEKIEVFLPIVAASTVRLLETRTGEIQALACRGIDEREWRSQERVVRGGRSETVIKTEAPLAVLNVQQDSRSYNAELFRRRGLVSYLGIPLIAHDRVLGTLNAYTREEHEFTSEEIEFMTTLAGQAAIAIHNAQLFEQSQRTIGRLAALREIDLAMASTVDLRSMLGLLLEKIDFFLPHHAASVRLQNLQTGKLDVVVSRNLDEERWKAHSLRSECRHHNYTVRVFESRAPLTVSNIAADAHASQKSFLLEQGLRSFAGVPLIVKEKCIGAITLYGRTEREFTLDEVDFLAAVAARAAVAIENAQLYESLQRHADELKRANSVKDDFLGVMSHELRTPLSVIIGYTAMLRDGLLGPLSDEQRAAVTKIILRGGDQLKIINSIMQAVQIQVGAARVERQAFEPAELLRALEADYRAIVKPDVKLGFDCADGLTPIVTDKAKLQQILQNLIDNALKFTPHGSVRVSARRAGGLLEFAVADNGIGIAEKDCVHIFDKFRQVDGSETRGYGGVGLGLYIVQSFAELLGGSVAVKSAVGAGSTFTVRLPYPG